MSLTIAPAQIVEQSDSPLLSASSEWSRAPLGDVATIINGYAFKSKQFVREGGTPLIRIRDITSDATSVGFVGDYESRYVVRPGDLLVGMDGDFNCARWRGPEALLNQRVCKIVPDPTRIDLDYLTHILPPYLQAIHDLTSSTTVTHLSSRDLALIPLPLPSLEEQHALARVLTATSDRLRSSGAHLRAARAAIASLRGAVLAAACSGRLTVDWRRVHPDAPSVTDALSALGFSRTSKRRMRDAPLDLALPEMPSDYVVASLGSTAEVLEYGTSVRCDSDANGLPVLRMGNIQDGAVDLADLKYCPRATDLGGLLLRSGDLLFNRTNSPELVGKSAVFRGPESMSFASYLIRVRFDPSIAHPDFVNYWINSTWGREWARLVKTDGVSQSNINGSKLAQMPIPLPPIAEQKEVVARASAALAGADKILQRVAIATSGLEVAAQAVLARALTGDMQSGNAVGAA
jgi:type I restriction enzyme S subunit